MEVIHLERRMSRFEGWLNRLSGLVIVFCNELNLIPSDITELLKFEIYP